jgi:hypothetical protein
MRNDRQEFVLETTGFLSLHPRFIGLATSLPLRREQSITLLFRTYAARYGPSQPATTSPIAFQALSARGS